MYKYLDRPELQDVLEHSRCVGNLGFKIATRLRERNQVFVDLNLNPELVRFLGYTHDIGKCIGSKRHEIITVFILTRCEKIPENIAQMTMHGQLYIDLRGKVPDLDPYILRGWEGIVLNYADMSVWTGKPISIYQRILGIINRIKKDPSISKAEKANIYYNLGRATKEFKLLETIILKNAGVDSVEDFKNPKIFKLKNNYKSLW